MGQHGQLHLWLLICIIVIFITFITALLLLVIFFSAIQVVHAHDKESGQKQKNKRFVLRVASYKNAENHNQRYDSHLDLRSSVIHDGGV